MESMTKLKCTKYTNFHSKHVKEDVQAIQQDMDLLYNEFIVEPDITFKSFSNAWKKLKFPCIFLGRISPKALLEFAQLCLHVSKTYLFARHLQYQVFGVYLIYGLYFNQPFKSRPAKLRLILDEYNELCNTLKVFNEESQFEALHIWHKLHAGGCFEYVAAPMEAGLEIGFRKYFASSNDDPPTVSDETTVDPLLLDNLDHLMKIYQEKKKLVFKNSEVFFGESNFVKEARNLLGMKIRNDDSSISSEEEASGSGTLRKSLKAKAFASGCIKPKAKPTVRKGGKDPSKSNYRSLGSDLARGFELNIEAAAVVDDNTETEIKDCSLPDIN